MNIECLKNCFSHFGSVIKTTKLFRYFVLYYYRCENLLRSLIAFTREWDEQLSYQRTIHSLLVYDDKSKSYKENMLFI